MTSSEKLAATLHREKPAKLIAYVGGDADGRNVAIRGGRKKWSQTVAAVEGLGAWTRCELLDKTGALLATVENTDPAGELQDLNPGKGGVWDQVERGLAIVLKAQEASAKQRGEEMRTVLQAQTELMRETSVAVKTLSALHQSHLETVRAASQAQLEASVASAAAESEGDIGQLMQALPQLLQLLPLLKGSPPGGH